MKKFAKLSLVAAVAVAGFTTANAGSLEEAIKNVDISGTAVYRYNDYGSDTDSDSINHYKVGVSLSSKVNDDIKFNSRFVTGTGTLNTVGTDNSTSPDANLAINLSQANFSYSGVANTTVIAGKQGLKTPWTNAIDSDGSEQTGTGILAMSTFGPITAAAGYLNQTAGISLSSTGTDLSAGGQDLVVAALLGKFGPVNAEAWYADFPDAADAFYAKLSTSVDVDAVKLGLAGEYNDVEVDGSTADYGMYKFTATAKTGIFGAALKYAKADDNGTGILNAVAQMNAIGWSSRMDKVTDEAEMFQVNVNAQVIPELNIALNYNDVDSDTNSEDNSEYYTQITYKPSKNFYTYIRFGEYTSGATDVDSTRGRLQVQYTF